MRPGSSILAALLFCLFLGGTGRENGTVYVSFGQHVDFYHSYRGDSPDEDGFGHDIAAVRCLADRGGLVIA